MSIAWPYACTDHDAGPDVTASRQLKAEVLSASIEASSLPPYLSIGSTLRIGKCWAKSDENARVTGSTTSTCTMSTPVCTCPSNPQWRSVTRRSWSGPTGHPSCHDAPRSVAVTGWVEASNVGTATVGGGAGGAVAGGTVGGVVGGAAAGTVVGGSVDGLTVVGVALVAAVRSSPDAPPHAARVARIAATATARSAFSPTARGGRRRRRARSRPRPLRRACPARCAGP